MTPRQKYKAFVEEFEQAQKAFAERAKIAFKDIVAEFFEKRPLVESFGWKQYPQYDDENTEFRVNTHMEAIEINGESEESRDHDSARCIKCENYIGYGKPFCPNCGASQAADEAPEAPEAFDVTEAARAAEEILSMFNDDILKTVYGERSHITVFRDGRIEVEDYDEGY